MGASSTLSKSCSLPIEACTMTCSSRVKPLRPSSMSDRCPSLRCSAVQQSRRRETYCFILSPFCQDRGPLGRRYCRNNSLDPCSVKGKNHSPHVVDQRVDTTWSSVNNFAQIIEANCLCRDECFTNKAQSCVPSHGNLLRLLSRYMRMYAFQHDYQQHHARKILKKLQRMPWRHNEIVKRRITRSQVDLFFSSCHCLETGKLAPRLYSAYKPRLADQRNEQ